MHERLNSILRQLRLSGLAQTLDVRLQEAAGHQLSHAEFLELILQDELLVRQERQIDRRVKGALFRETKALDQFDWSFSATAILDRFLHHAEIISITGKSYRLRGQKGDSEPEAAGSKPAKAPTGTNPKKKPPPDGSSAANPAA